MTAKTPAQRKAAERERKRAAGLVEFRAWVLPSVAAALRKLAESLKGKS